MRSAQTLFHNKSKSKLCQLPYNGRGLSEAAHPPATCVAMAVCHSTVTARSQHSHSTVGVVSESRMARDELVLRVNAGRETREKRGKEEGVEREGRASTRDRGTHVATEALQSRTPRE